MDKLLRTRGFTLIELLVVISIIGLLSSVALAALSSARTKAVETALKESFISIGKEMELHVSNDGYYTGACGSSVDSMVQQVAQQYGKQPPEWGCISDSSYLVYILLPNDQYYCMDSSGGTYVQKTQTTVPGLSCD